MNIKSLDHLPDNLIKIYQDIEEEMLLNIVKLLKANPLKSEKDAVAWKLQMLDNMGILDGDNIKAIRKKLNVSRRELNEMIYIAGTSITDFMDEDLEKYIGKYPSLVKPPKLSKQQIIDILEAYIRQASNTMNLTNQTMIDSTKQAYIDIINNISVNVQSGFMTSQQAIRRSINKWAEKGIPALIDRAGREWGVEGYLRTVFRSTTNNVVHEMQDKRFDDWGVDLVEVSSHIGARPKCAPYQGKIYSLKPGHSKYPWIGDTSIGQPDGLFGINCGHYKYAYLDGISTRTYTPYDEEENKRVYEESQRQRAIERSIRKAKRRQQMLLELGDKEGANKAGQLVRNRQALMRKFIDKTGRTRRYGREQVYGS